MNREDAPPSFETLGYFLEIWDAETRWCLGTVKQLDTFKPCGRKYGEAGEIAMTLTHDLEITVGHKTKVLRASEAKPLNIFTRLQPICGRMLRNIHSK